MTDLHEMIPYWTTITATVRGGKRLPLLVMKDGTIAVGLRTSGLDIQGSENEELDLNAQHITEALASLPEGTYLQAVFESGESFAPLIDKFREQSTDEYPLLSVGRLLQAERFERGALLSRCTITYWLGIDRALAYLPSARIGSWERQLSRLKLSGTVPMTDAERLRKAAQKLQDALDGFTRPLTGIGLRWEVLDETQLVAACHLAINPRSKLPAPIWLETDDDIEDYKEGKPLILRGETLAEQLAVGAFTSNSSTITRGNPPVLLRALTATSLPTYTTAKALYAAMYEHMPIEPFRIVVTHKATANRFGSTEKYTHRITFLTKLASGVNAQAAKCLDQNKAVLEELADRPARLLDTTVFVIVSGKDELELERATQEVFLGFQKGNIQIETAEEDQHLAWLASLPASLPHDDLKKRTLLDYSAAHLTPYWLPDLGSETPDMLVENYQRGIEGLSVRRSADRPTATAVVSGGTGAGKTVLALAIAKYGILDQGGYVFITDNKGKDNSSWRPVTEEIGGSWVGCCNDLNVAISPLPARADMRLAEKQTRETPDEIFDPLDPAQRMIRIMCNMSHTFDGLNEKANQQAEYARTVLSLVLPLIYERLPETREVLLEEVVAALDQYQDTDKIRAEVARTMHSRLGNWITPPNRNRLFNRPTNLNMDNRWSVFDFHGIENDGAVGAVLLSSLGARIEAKFRSLPRSTPKGSFWDEAWAMAEHSVEAVRLQGRLARLGRSLGAFCYFITHKMSDLANNNAGKGAEGILALTQMHYLLKYDEAKERDVAASVLQLTDRQRELLRDLKAEPGKYSDCLRVDTAKNRTHVFQYWPTPFDLWLDTSRPEDVDLRNEVKKDTGQSFLETVVDLSQRYPTGAPAKKAAPEVRA